jgi:hypothetical protein
VTAERDHVGGEQAGRVELLDDGRLGDLEGDPGGRFGRGGEHVDDLPP